LIGLPGKLTLPTLRMMISTIISRSATGGSANAWSM